MKKFKMYSDDFGNDNTGAVLQSDATYIRDLQADTEVVITIPTGARFALFQTDSDPIWARFGGSTLTVPVGDLDDQTIMINPDLRYVDGNTTIRVISPSVGTLVVSFYG